MEQEELFGMALGLVLPWYITKIEFKQSSSGTRQLHIWIDFKPGSKFVMEDGISYTAYDTREREWRHLNFFQHECYLHSRLPRVKTKDQGILTVKVPWARQGSSFTLLFEAFALSLVSNEMSLPKAGAQMEVDGRVIGRILGWHVNLAMRRTKTEQPDIIGIDETAISKGHNYISVVTDLERKKVLAISAGKDKAAIQNTVHQLQSKGVDAGKVKCIGMDLSPAYISAATEFFPKATIVFDRFHLDKLLNEAMDQLRKSEQQECQLLKKTKYLWLKNPRSLTKKQASEVEYLAFIYPKIGEAYRLKLQYKEIWNSCDNLTAPAAINKWLQLVDASGIFPLQKFAATVRAHWSGIITYFNHKITNAFAERINLKIQEAKRRARGYRNINNFIDMIFFLCGKLDFDYPLKIA